MRSDRAPRSSRNDSRRHVRQGFGVEIEAIHTVGQVRLFIASQYAATHGAEPETDSR